MSPRLHMLAGVPVIVAGIAGLAHGDLGQRLDEPPGRLQHCRRPGRRRASRGRRCSTTARSGTSSCTCTWPGTSSSASASPRSTPGVGCAGGADGTSASRSRFRSRRPLLAAPLQVVVGDWAGRDVARYQPSKLAAFEGLGQHDDGRARCTCSAGTPTATSATGSRSRACSRCSPRTTRTRRSPGSTACRPAERPPVNVVRIAFQTMVGIGTLLAALALRRCCGPGGDGAACPRSRWFYRAVVLAGPLSLVALDRRLGDDRGRPPALGRLPRDADARTRSPARAASLWATRPSCSSTPGSAVAVWWVLRRLAAAPLPEEARS